MEWMAILKAKRKRVHDRIDEVMKDGEWRTADAVLQIVKQNYRNVPMAQAMGWYMAKSGLYEVRPVENIEQLRIDEHHSPTVVNEYKMEDSYIRAYRMADRFAGKGNKKMRNTILEQHRKYGSGW